MGECVLLVLVVWLLCLCSSDRFAPSLCALCLPFGARLAWAQSLCPRQAASDGVPQIAEHGSRIDERDR